MDSLGDKNWCSQVQRLLNKHVGACLNLRTHEAYCAGLNVDILEMRTEQQHS